jgi:ATP phosphoribosyltransferase regulatory subunit
MPGRTSTEREALAKQNAAIMAVFERAGFEQIAPDIIQPADIFLERSGEDIRARTFVFNDPDGNELCLRPDLTVPACRFHLAHAPDREARYCYLGQAFRFPDEKLSPQEFTQAGIEWFGGDKPVEEEARILKLAISALEATGVQKFRVMLGDLGLFNALLDDMPMPDRWRRRLQHQFWRPDAFRELVESFSRGSAGRRSSISPLIDRLSQKDALAVVHEAFAELKLSEVTLRTPDDIAARLAEKHSDRSEAPLAQEHVAAISQYLDIEGPAHDVAVRLKALSKGNGFQSAVRAFEARNAALEELGLNPRRFHFSANFGRELEYYTGFVFQIDAHVGNHPVSLAGGGRYDELLSDLGAAHAIPAVGCAIHTERVKAVLA